MSAKEMISQALLKKDVGCEMVWLSGSKGMFAPLGANILVLGGIL